ncbi:NAD(P)H-hydrate dehydratase [Variovorax sp. J22P271]|uniref:NAD(P)H-hydrate dehydratase n=1 Tax=Variovorax davisae TaxID=3053515 RepID=UPI0025769F15|nr:NAD(P)H-hydrate dehydratase [Variovorax sp. J22P271]MDM0035685.1 NAD(P)H-hydrate dehydratase [Variovorax sp. J22P271]
MDATGSRPKRLTPAALARWPLPKPGDDADKEDRGHVLIVAGSQEMPGAALLAAVAALRAGAGKLTMAAPACIAQGLAFAVPEARVVSLPQARSGGLLVRGGDALAATAEHVRALVVGPGMQDERATVGFVRALMPLFSHATVVLDALALSIVRHGALDQPTVLTPHAGEMAYLSGQSKEAVCADPVGAAREAATRWNGCVALKGGSTVIASPDGAMWKFDDGAAGLATSGSGDTLAGLIGGLAARGLQPLPACAWGVVAHASAGAALARLHGPVGYLARELARELPGSLHALSQRRRRGSSPSPTRALVAG